MALLPTGLTRKSTTVRTFTSARIALLCMTFVSMMLVFFALATAPQLADYWATKAYGHAIGTVLFNGFAFGILADNIYNHLILR